MWLDLEFIIGQKVYVLEPEDYVIRQEGQCFVGIQPMGMDLWYVYMYDGRLIKFHACIIWQRAVERRVDQ